MRWTVDILGETLDKESKDAGQPDVDEDKREYADRKSISNFMFLF